MDIFKVGELTNDKALTTIAFSIFQVSMLYSMYTYHTRDAHFSGLEFLVEKREKWPISRREKIEKSRKNKGKIVP